MLPTGRVHVVRINSSRSQNQLKAHINEQQVFLKLKEKEMNYMFVK